MPEEYWIERPEQLHLLENAVRLEILDAVDAGGAMSVREIARELGRPADGLYYHVELLERGGLLQRAGTRATRRRDAAIYELPAERIRLRYSLDDPARMAVVKKIASAILRVAEKDFETGVGLPWAEAEGEERNLWAARLKGWLSPAEIRRVNALLNELREIFEGASRREDSRLVALAWVLTPEEDRPVRR